MHTLITKLLGIKYPIIQAPMNWITGANLVSAVSNAGGLGTLGPNAGQKSPAHSPFEVGEGLRSQITKVRNLTDRPFAVNLSVSRREFSDKVAEIMIEERVPVAISIMGPPDLYTGRLKDAGIKVIHAVTTVRHAERAQAVGVDAVVAEGYEGGGHIGNDDLTTMTLIPQLVDAVRIPVIAAGGIFDARGFVAALSLGAEAVYIGTGFLATIESDAHQNLKEAVLRATDTSTVAHGRKLGHGLVRQLKNKFSEKYLEMELGGASAEDLQRLWDSYPGDTSGFAVSRMYYALCCGDISEGCPAAGAISGAIKDIVPAEEVIKRIIEGAPEILKKLKSVIRE